jgi:hypothetical protein
MPKQKKQANLPATKLYHFHAPIDFPFELSRKLTISLPQIIMWSIKGISRASPAADIFCVKIQSAFDISRDFDG